MDNNFGERIVNLESKSEFHDRILEKQEKRLDKLEDTTTTLRDMKLLIEINTETQRDLVDNLKEINKRQEKFDDRLDRFDFTLGKVNSNLSLLNQSQLDMRHEMLELKDDISSTKKHVKEVEKMQELEKEKNMLDLSGLPKKFILYIVGGLCTIGISIASAYFLLKLGLK